MFCQFYVSQVDAERPVLSLQMYQRSADIGLGVPFNITSYSLLLVMIAHVVGMTPGDFVHVLGDAHVYMDHKDALKVQLEREPRSFPTITVKKEAVSYKELVKLGRDGGVVERVLEELISFRHDDFSVQGYEPYARIAMKMSV